MSVPTEGYVLHTYGKERYLHHAVASVVTLRRHDAERPVALFAPREHHEILRQHGLDDHFQHLGELPEAYRSVVGFKHHLYRFAPFDHCLYVDSDVVWCRDPDPLWRMLSAYTFTATGLNRADFFFGGPKGASVLVDAALDHRRRTMKRFDLTHLPRVQAGMIYSADHDRARTVCEQAAAYLKQREDTHFRSRLAEGRSEESCEWSMAMAMSSLRLPILPWFQGYNSPQLDFIDGLTTYDPDFEEVTCRYYCNRFVYSVRGLQPARLRDVLLSTLARLPGLGDYLDVTPFALHFGWIQHKAPFNTFAERVWQQQVRPAIEASPQHDAEQNAEQLSPAKA